MIRTDEELVARATAGDVDSFNQLVSRWERTIYALAYRTLGREEDARDVVQEAFLRAYRGLRGFKGEAKFSSWLYRITLNLCRDWIRRERRAPVVQPPEGTDAVDLADAQASPTESVEDLVARREMSRAVSRAMAELPEEQRTAILLKEYHGLTFQEIADQLNCPLSTVKTRLYQGLSVLRRRLDRQQSEEASLRRATWEGTELRGPIVMCENRERLIGYVYDECDPAERREIEAHLESCHTCRRRDSRTRSVRQDLLAWDVPASDPIWRPMAPARQESSWRAGTDVGLAAAACATFMVGAAGGAATYALMPQIGSGRRSGVEHDSSRQREPRPSRRPNSRRSRTGAGPDARRARHARPGCRCRAAQRLRQHRAKPAILSDASTC